jgi:hypothetical protein
VHVIGSQSGFNRAIQTVENRRRIAKLNTVSWLLQATKKRSEAHKVTICLVNYFAVRSLSDDCTFGGHFDYIDFGSDDDDDGDAPSTPDRFSCRPGHAAAAAGSCGRDASTTGK